MTNLDSFELNGGGSTGTFYFENRKALTSLVDASFFAFSKGKKCKEEGLKNRNLQLRKRLQENLRQKKEGRIVKEDE